MKFGNPLLGENPIPVADSGVAFTLARAVIIIQDITHATCRIVIFWAKHLCSTVCVCSKKAKIT